MEPIWPTIMRLTLNDGGNWNTVIDSSRRNNFYLEAGADDDQALRWFVPCGPQNIGFHLWLDAWWDEDWGTLEISLAGPYAPGTLAPSAGSGEWIFLCEANFDKPGAPPGRVVGDIGAAIPETSGLNASLYAPGGAVGTPLTTIDDGIGDGGPGYYYIRAVPTGIVQLSEAWWMTQTN